MIRAFFAIPLIENLIEPITTALGPIKNHLGKDVRWVPVDKWHITIRFFAKINVTDLSQISKLTDKILRNCGHFNINLTKISTFPNDYGHVIAIYLSTCDQLTQIFTQIDEITEMVNIKKDSRSFHPHITLGRFRGRSKKYQPISLTNLNFSVNEIILYESKFMHGGSKYLILQRFPLNPYP